MHDIGLLEYLSKEWKSRNFARYTSEYSERAKKQCRHSENLLTAEEHSKMSEVDFACHFESIDKLIKWYFGYLSNIGKMGVLSCIGEFIKQEGAKNIISYGAGPSVLEYFLKMIFQEDIHIVVTDYDEFIVDGVRKLFNNMKAERFDFYKDDPEQLISKYKIDTAIMIGSACSMDNGMYIQFLRRLEKCNIQTIFTFEAGVYNSLAERIRSDVMKFLYLLKLCFLYIFHKSAYESRKERFMTDSQCFHACSRSINELEKIYVRGGYMFTRIGHVECYPVAYKLQRVGQG